MAAKRANKPKGKPAAKPKPRITTRRVQATEKLPPPQRNGSLSLGDLRPDPQNARRHTPRNIGTIVDALHKVGAARSIVIDEDNVILAGNGVFEAAGEAGIERVHVVDADGETIIAVRRSGLTKKQKAELAIADNRAAELAEWDVPALTGLADEVGLDLKDVGFSDEDMRGLRLGDDAGEATEDEAPDAADVERRCKAGDLWELGTHRLLCGDSTNAENVGRLLAGAVPFIMVTDPPYGVEYDPALRSENRTGKVSNDDRANWSETYALFPGAVAYVWHAGWFVGVVANDLDGIGFERRVYIVWAKPHFQLGRGHYHWQHEPCWYAVRKGATAKWCGDRTQSTLWDIAHVTPNSSDDGQTVHGTQKPVECMARPIRNHGGPDDDVYDPFVGSGTTIIAAEQLGRRCFAMELSEEYCDVVLDRWEKFTGEKATKAGA